MISKTNRKVFKRSEKVLKFSFNDKKSLNYANLTKL